jgi:hypothetical protein
MLAPSALYPVSVRRINAESTAAFTEELRCQVVLLLALTESPEQNEWFALRILEINFGHVPGTCSGTHSIESGGFGSSDESSGLAVVQ